jgi:hypothetical protein
MFLALFYLALFAHLPSLVIAHTKLDSPLSCSASHPECLGNFFNTSSVVGALLDSNSTRIFENGLVNQSSCAAVSVIFARGTLELGMSICHLVFLYAQE